MRDESLGFIFFLLMFLGSSYIFVICWFFPEKWINYLQWERKVRKDYFPFLPDKMFDLFQFNLNPKDNIWYARTLITLWEIVILLVGSLLIRKLFIKL
jgi:hypothetical protein